jgi:hypothetical protein
MPTHRAGREVQQDPIRLKNLLRQAEERLAEEELRPPEIQALLEPGHKLLADGLFWQRQSNGLALLLSDDVSRVYRLPFEFEELLVVADRFHVKPLLAMLSGDGRFFVLALSQKEVRLLQGTRYSVDDVELEAVPGGPARALGYEHEKQVQFHTSTAAPGGKGERPALFHGQGVTADNHLKDDILLYFHRVNAGVTQALAGERAPLVLAGVDYLLPIYRESNTYPNLAKEGILGNPDGARAKELHDRAWILVEPLLMRARDEAAARYRQLAGAGSERASNDLETIVPAAYVGRVDALFVAVGLQCWGTFDPDTNAIATHEAAASGREDLLDLAAVYTMANGGEVFAVGPDDVPGGSAAAALFRY